MHIFVGQGSAKSDAHAAELGSGPWDRQSLAVGSCGRARAIVTLKPATFDEILAFPWPEIVVAFFKAVG
jgi:hypothetical protein